MVVVLIESDLVDVERLGAVDIGHGNSDELELHVHVLSVAASLMSRLAVPVSGESAKSWVYDTRE